MPHRDRATPRASAREGEAPGKQAKKTPAASEVPEIISHADMNAAVDQDLAVPLGQVVRYILRYLGHWWIPFEGGWIRADPALAAMLDAESARMTAQDAIVARNAAIRAALNAVQAPAGAKPGDTGDAATRPGAGLDSHGTQPSSGTASTSH